MEVVRLLPSYLRNADGIFYVFDLKEHVRKKKRTKEKETWEKKTREKIFLEKRKNFIVTVPPF